MMVAKFWRIGIDTNLDKNKAMVCTPGFISGKLGDLAYKKRATREGANFRERKKTRVSCATCGVTMAVSYLKAHMDRIHGICAPQTRRVDVVVEWATT